MVLAFGFVKHYEAGHFNYVEIYMTSDIIWNFVFNNIFSEKFDGP